jgi:hypothetical protein
MAGRSVDWTLWGTPVRSRLSSTTAERFALPFRTAEPALVDDHPKWREADRCEGSVTHSRSFAHNFFASLVSSVLGRVVAPAPLSPPKFGANPLTAYAGAGIAMLLSDRRPPYCTGPPLGRPPSSVPPGHHGAEEQGDCDDAADSREDDHHYRLRLTTHLPKRSAATASTRPFHCS